MTDEFRSPLHGILASSHLLRELTSDESQLELLSTVQDCGHTLLVSTDLGRDVYILKQERIPSITFSTSAKSILSARWAQLLTRVLKVSRNSSTAGRTYSNLTGRILNELHSATNVAVLCEDVVDVMVAASAYATISKPTDLFQGNVNSSTRPARGKKSRAVELVLDLENRDWNFLTQPGKSFQLG